MRAIRMHAYGGPEVLTLEEVPTPKPGPLDVRVAVHATAVNPADFKIRAGGQRAVVWLSLPWTLGMDVSGEVLEVGARVTAFKPGDQVVASPSHRRMGCYADEVSSALTRWRSSPRRSAMWRRPRCRWSRSPPGMRWWGR